MKKNVKEGSQTPEELQPVESMSDVSSCKKENKAELLIEKSNSKNKDSKNVTDDKIRVYMRMRPPLGDEISFNYEIQDNTIIIKPLSTKPSSYFCVDKLFTFRSIMDKSTNQGVVYHTVAEPLIPEFLAGNDVLIFCYGNTNAGKTYTVTGTQRNPGILFKILSKVVPELLACGDIHISASFTEIYNERIFDLLSENRKQSEGLQIGYNSIGDTEVKNCVEIPIKSVEDAHGAVQTGLDFRHWGENELNTDSSRSHAVFRLKASKPNGRYNWLSVVDLAGAERVSVMRSSIGSFKEACNINRSMLVLGRCIRALKEPKLPIPYRESKITHIFKNLFEPTNRAARAAMIINVSPSVVQFEDTIFALQFAAEASQCSIRQNNSVSTKVEEEDINMQPEYSPYELQERRIRLEIQHEMESALLERRMAYEHQIKEKAEIICSQYIMNGNGYNRENEKGKNDEIEKLKAELFALEAENSALEAEVVAIGVDTDATNGKAESALTDRNSFQLAIKDLAATLNSMGVAGYY